MSKLSDLLDFVRFTQKFQQIKRTVLVKNEWRYENDLEHSAQLAMVGWYIVETEKLDLDVNLIIKYSLAHDLVETYAGDIPFYEKGERKGKEEREKEAFRKIKKEFSNFKELHRLIKQYEQKKDKESNFVYALDKLLPKLTIYLDTGRSWKADGVTYDLVAKELSKARKSPRVEKYYKDLLKVLKKDRKRLFP